MQQQLNMYAFYGPSNGRRFRGEPMGSGQDFRVKERYEEYQACGFDSLLLEHEADYCGEPFATSELKRIMDICQEIGLGVILLDLRLEKLANYGKQLIGETVSVCGQEYQFHNQEDIDRVIAECMKDYSVHPAFRGVYLMDEPKYSQLISLCQVQRSIKKYKQDTYIHVCLNPLCSPHMYMSDDTLTKEENYRKYIIYYLEHGGNDTICYDDYPFRYDERDGCYFLQNYIRSMEIVREESNKRGVGCFLTIGAFSDETNPEAGFRKLGESDIRMQALVPLAYGYDGLSWYYYWSEPYKSAKEARNAKCQSMINENGEYDLYSFVQKVNEEIKMLCQELSRFSYVGTEFFSTEENVPDYFSAKAKYRLQTVKYVKSDANIFVSEFKNGEQMAFFIMNFNDPLKDVSANVSFTVDVQNLQCYMRGEWTEIEKEKDSFSLHLKAGDGAFIVL